MDILVLLKMVPDVVEELQVDASGKALDTEFLRMILSEQDAHALEQALLLKERQGARVTVLAREAPEVDQALYEALAKGADRAVRIQAADGGAGTRPAATQFAQVIAGDPVFRGADLILTGTQANDDLDGLLAPLVAHELGLPFLGIVVSVSIDAAGGSATAVREYPGGVRGEFSVALPAVVGIQAAEKSPRYVPVAKVRAVMKSASIGKVEASGIFGQAMPQIEVLEMAKPAAAGKAAMVEGPIEAVAVKLTDILSERGLL